MIAAVVAAVGLGLTAWGTLKSAQVADDQLTQSRANQLKDAQAQASLITMWTEFDPPPKVLMHSGGNPGRLVLANRSLDPIQVALHGAVPNRAALAPGVIPTAPPPREPRIFYFGSVPPCTRVTLTRAALLQISWRPIDGSDALSRAGGNGFSVESITFTDRSGQTWKRSRDGFLTKAQPPQAYTNQFFTRDKPPEGDPFSPVAHAQMQQLDGCSPN